MLRSDALLLQEHPQPRTDFCSRPRAATSADDNGNRAGLAARRLTSMLSWLMLIKPFRRLVMTRNPAMLTITQAQIHAMVLANRPQLIREITRHLAEFRPGILRAYPLPYLRWLINDSIEQAKPFKIDDAYSMRLFVRLRWEIAPGYYRHPQIADILRQTDRPARQRFEELTGNHYAEAWEQARQLTGGREWRGGFWLPGG